MPVRSHVIAHGTQLVPAGGLTIYTVPEGRTMIVKDVVLTNNTGASSTLTLQFRTANVSVGMLRGVVADADRLASSGRFIVGGPGDQLKIVSSVSAGTVGWSVHGSLLLGAPT